MKKIRSILGLSTLFFLTVFPVSAKACTCADAGQFSEYAKLLPNVIRATVLNFGNELANRPDYYENIKVEATEVVRGQINTMNLTLLGDSGMSCFKFITRSQFEIGNEYLFLLQNAGGTQGLWGCGESFLLIDGDKAVGRSRKFGVPRKYSIDLKNLYQLLRE